MTKPLTFYFEIFYLHRSNQLNIADLSLVVHSQHLSFLLCNGLRKMNMYFMAKMTKPHV